MLEYNNLIKNNLTFLSFFIYYYSNKYLDKQFHLNDMGLRILSTLHSIGCFTSSLMFLLGYINNVEISYLLIFISKGYFFYDIYYLLKYKKLDISFIQYLLHHIVCFIAIDNVRKYPIIVTQGFLSEITAPFLNISWYLNKIKRKNYIYFGNGILIMILFLKYRILNFYTILNNIDLVIFSSKNNIEFYFYKYLMTFLWGLNIFWFVCIIKLFFKDLNYSPKKIMFTLNK